MLCEKLYLMGGVTYKELKGDGTEAEKIRNEVIELKEQVDARLRGSVREIYRKLKIEYEK